MNLESAPEIHKSATRIISDGNSSTAIPRAAGLRQDTMDNAGWIHVRPAVVGTRCASAAAASWIPCTQSNSSAAASPIWKVLGGNPVMVKSALQQTEEQETIETFQK